MNYLTELKAHGIALALEKVTGVEPIVEEKETYYSIHWLPAEQSQVLQNLSDRLPETGDSDIRIEWFPVVRPVIIKKALPYAIGIFAAGFLIGKVL